MTGETRQFSPCFWRGAGLWYLAFCLAGLSAGLWPDAVLFSKTGPRPLPLPTLQTLAVAQAAFFLLVYPFVILRRSEKGDKQGDSPHLSEKMGTVPGKMGTVPFAETLVLLVVSAPFYYVAAYLADAVVIDAIRTAVGVACLIPLSWSAASWLCRGGPWRAAGALLLLVAALGLPAATYVAAETLKPEWSDWLWQLSPATYLWQNAAPRIEFIFPRPLWPALTCLTAAAAMFLLTLLSGSSSENTPRPGAEANG